ICRRGRRRLRLACALPRSRTRWRGRLDASGRPAGGRSRPWHRRNGRERILTVGAIEAIGKVGGTGGALPHHPPGAGHVYGGEEAMWSTLPRLSSSFHSARSDTVCCMKVRTRGASRVHCRREAARSKSQSTTRPRHGVTPHSRPLLVPRPPVRVTPAFSKSGTSR